MSRNTTSFALPESMREYIDARVRDGDYGRGELLGLPHRRSHGGIADSYIVSH